MPALAEKDQKLFTADDFRKLPEDFRPCQVVQGRLYMSPSPHWAHQRIITNLLFELELYLRAHPIGEVCAAPMDVYLNHLNAFQPDILYVSNENCGIIKERVEGAPDLVIEVLSPGTANLDLKVKRKIYLEGGVKEMWFVHPTKKTVEVHRNGSEGVEAPVLLKKEDVLTTPLLPGFELRLAEVFDRV